RKYMNFNEYQELSKRTMPEPEIKGVILRIYDKQAKANYAMGLSGESGEVTDLIKKELFHGHSEDPFGIQKELGDVLHYLSGLATMYGLTLEEVAMANIEKLKKRYPDGFSQEASINRED
ncbi:MAG: nucleoside triphosphate pyrophosphohydrolase family protein, partial [Ruminococcus sp.]